MVVTSTLARRSRFLAPWIALLGDALAAVLMFGSRFVDRVMLVLPSWVLHVSLYIRVDNLPNTRPASVPGAAARG